MEHGPGALEDMVTAGGFWPGRRVLVTGHTGFKGSWLSLLLHRLGARVAGCALPAEVPGLFAAARLDDLVHAVGGNVCDPEAMHRAVADAMPEIVIHMAAQSLVGRSYRDPAGTYAVNVMGTVHLLEAVRACPGVQAVLVVTSDKCYENREWLWGYREHEALGGHDPYSSSKAAAELVAQSWRRSYFQAEDGTRIATARAGNVIGGGDWAEGRLLPDIMRSVQRGEPVQIRNPDAVRPWQHVLDPLAGYLQLAERLCDNGQRYAGAWNFGPADEDARPVGWVVDQVCRLWGAGAAWARDAQPHPHEAHHLRLDCAKARSELGWRPRLPLAQALEWSVAWYRDCQREPDGARRATLAQIDRYLELTS